MYGLYRKIFLIRRFSIAILSIVALTSTASADCVWSDLVGDTTSTASIDPGPTRVHFVEDNVIKVGCPAVSSRCQARAFVVPGDIVLTGPVRGEFICAGFQSARGADTVGWLPSEALTPSTETARSLADWVGEWSAAERDIVIVNAADGALTVTGDATWGMKDPQQEGIVHTGTLNGTAKLDAGVLAFTEGDETTLRYDEGDEFSCRVRMILRGPYLLARDNNNCGGLNVSFSGFYRRKG